MLHTHKSKEDSIVKEKKQFVLYLCIIILVSILPFLGILLTPELPHTSDGEVQIPRMAAFYKAVTQSNIPVRWAGYLNYGYGLPLFNFIYHTPFYISTILIGLGINLVLTFKIVLALSYVFSGIFFYLFAYEFFEDSKVALLTTILYQFAPFRLVEVLVRGAVGGIYAYTFFPLVLFGITKLNKKFSTHSFLLTSIAVALLVLSHNSLALVFFGITILFVFFFSPAKKIQIVGALVTGLLLSAFYWAPALIEHKYTYGDLFMKNLYRVNFPPFINFFIPNPFDSKSLRISEISLHWGILPSIIPFIGIFLLTKRKIITNRQQRIILFSLLVLGANIFFMNPASSFIWERISFLRQFQFPWRLLAIVVFATSFLGGLLLSLPLFKKPFVFWGIIIVTVAATVFYWQPTQGYDVGVTDAQFWNYPLNTTYFGETDVIWSAGPAKGYPKAPIEIAEGNGTISSLIKKNAMQSFTTTSDAPVRMVSYTQYFPGWQVFIDGKKTLIQFQDPAWRGLITFWVPGGNHNIRISFQETPIRLVSDGISLISLLSCFGAIVFTTYKKLLKVA
jgi:hypothetical protein